MSLQPPINSMASVSFKSFSINLPAGKTTNSLAAKVLSSAPALVMMLSSGYPGLEVTYPLAAVVIAGLIVSTAPTLLVLPVLYR